MEINTCLNSVFLHILMLLFPVDGCVFNICSSHRSVEKTTRERFGWVLERRVAELKLRSATRSPISGLVENAVVEVRSHILFLIL